MDEAPAAVAATSTMDDERLEMYRLVARQLNDDGLGEAAKALGVELDESLPRDALLELLRAPRGLGPAQDVDVATMEVDEGSMPSAPAGESLDEDDEGDLRFDPGFTKPPPSAKSRIFPPYTTRFITSHKGTCRAACFSSDGLLVATASADNSIKILEVAKMHYHSQIKGTSNALDEEHPVVKTLYDHQHPINEVTFHPIRPFLVSCSKDRTIKFFDYSRPNSRRAFRQIDEDENIRTINFHPTGDYLLAGGESPHVIMYDMNTFQPYITESKTGLHTLAINQVRFAPSANVYASCSKDGSIKIWDGVSSQCVRTIAQAHSGLSVSSVRFSQNGDYLLSSGVDSTVRLWELSSGREVLSYDGIRNDHQRLQAVFAWSDDFVLGSDESSSSVVVWDSRTGHRVQTLSGHTKVVRWIASSPVEPAFVSCSDDHRARFWAVDK